MEQQLGKLLLCLTVNRIMTEPEARCVAREHHSRRLRRFLVLTSFRLRLISLRSWATLAICAEILVLLVSSRLVPTFSCLFGLCVERLSVHLVAGLGLEAITVVVLVYLNELRSLLVLK